MMGLRPRQGNLRLVFRLFSLMRGLPRGGIADQELLCLEAVCGEIKVSSGLNLNKVTNQFHLVAKDENNRLKLVGSI